LGKVSKTITWTGYLNFLSIFLNIYYIDDKVFEIIYYSVLDNK